MPYSTEHLRSKSNNSMTRCSLALLISIWLLSTVFGLPVQTTAWAFSSKSRSPKSKLLESLTTESSSADKTYGKTVWAPPSKNVAQRKGKVFSIEKPQDLLDFVIEDERLSVVKVYASWCKTCQVFDVRYRKLANQFSDTYDPKTQSVTKLGRARFSEMQYDNPNNEEMCQLLNATKLPYILMYKGSKGKVDEFQCGPGNFQVLIDAVNQYADSEEDLLTYSPVVAGVNLTVADTIVADTEKDAKVQKEENIQPADFNMELVESLRQQLGAANNEKEELFEIMKADLDWHKEQIQKLNEEIKKQHDQYEGLLRARDMEINNITNASTEQQQRLDNEASSLRSQLDELSDTILDDEDRIQSLEEELTRQLQKSDAAALKAKQTIELEKQLAIYERERNSLRKLCVLAVKRVWRGAGSFLSRFRRK